MYDLKVPGVLWLYKGIARFVSILIKRNQERIQVLERGSVNPTPHPESKCMIGISIEGNEPGWKKTAVIFIECRILYNTIAQLMGFV